MNIPSPRWLRQVIPALTVLVLGFSVAGCGLFGSDSDDPPPVSPSEWEGDWNVDTFDGNARENLYYSITSEEIEIFAGENCPDEVASIQTTDDNVITGTFESSGENLEIRVDEADASSLVFTILDSPSEAEVGAEVVASSVDGSIRDVAAGCTSASGTQRQSNLPSLDL
jgi:hypothetical protein